MTWGNHTDTGNLVRVYGINLFNYEVRRWD